MTIVFYGNQIWGEFINWREMRKASPPEGSYVHSDITTGWYLIYMGTCMPVLESEVPPMCKAWMLIL